ncbi:MAG: SapC family protein [Candidatus Andeanibacterium colombiense]|uniref:SapC family protein n=1 Tax=Candidatus Andeanibacterium colombiense TaxID=3121345 RepID=A0AAJ5X3Z4_9SPHN|nr:MAG: SapC family protein [Sphingomonadaceae bacterium]
MASVPNNLPLFYKDLMPLNLRDHEKWSAHRTQTADWLVDQHAVPLTVDEFALAQRDFPIVFSSGDAPVPLALFGLNEGVNVYVDEKGLVANDAIYVPAYARRYPFMLARMDSKSDSMTLCFDPTAGLLGEFEDGDRLFEEGGEPTAHTQAVLKFCEDFEVAGQRTQAFMDELKKNDLLIEGEVGITQEGLEQPFIYRGFQLINREKFNEVRGDQLRSWNQSGFLALVHAHFFSLDLMRIIFARQTQQGKGPGAELAAAKAAESASKN